MKNLSFISRFISAGISFLYMLLVLPHIGSIGTDEILNAHPLYWFGWFIASIWILLIFIHLNEQKLGSSIVDFFCFGSLDRVDKRDSQSLRVLIQDCFLRSSHGSWGLVGCGVGTDRAAAAA